MEGFHKWGYPNSWMVDLMENAIYKWMMKWGTPMLGNHHMEYGGFHGELGVPQKRWMVNGRSF